MAKSPPPTAWWKNARITAERDAERGAVEEREGRGREGRGARGASAQDRIASVTDHDAASIRLAAETT